MYDIIDKTANLYAFAALIQPPPKLNYQVTKWVQKMYLNHVLFMLRRMGRDIKEIRGWDIVANTPINLLAQPQVTQFPFDTEGWKYEKILNKFEEFPDLRRDIQIIIEPGGGDTDQEAIFHHFANTVEIYQPVPTEQEVAKFDPQQAISFLPSLMSKLSTAVDHELIHASQYIISDAMYSKKEEDEGYRIYEETGAYPDEVDFKPPGLFGMPPRKTRSRRDPSGFALSPITKNRLKKKRQVHQLRDIEFYPSLLDAVNRFKRYTVLHSLWYPENYPLANAIKIYVGAAKSAKGFLAPNTFFVKLRRYNKDKWQKAVKEFINAVVNDVSIKENLM